VVTKTVPPWCNTIEDLRLIWHVFHEGSLGQAEPRCNKDLVAQPIYMRKDANTQSNGANCN